MSRVEIVDMVMTALVALAVVVVATGMVRS